MSHLTSRPQCPHLWSGLGAWVSHAGWWWGWIRKYLRPCVAPYQCVAHWLRHKCYSHSLSLNTKRWATKCHRWGNGSFKRGLHTLKQKLKIPGDTKKAILTGKEGSDKWARNREMQWGPLKTQWPNAWEAMGPSQPSSLHHLSCLPHAGNIHWHLNENCPRTLAKSSK